jgi:diaminopimelate decarboxylase
MGRVAAHIVAAGTAKDRPTYVYDLAALRSRCAQISALPLPRKQIFFATMANDHPDVIDTVRGSGLGVFVNSRKHLDIALATGVAPKQVLYASSNMIDEEMRYCAGLGVRVVLDSVDQVRRFGVVAGPDREIGLRVSVGFVDGPAVQDDPGYRFGVLPDELPAAVALAREYGLRIGGVHSYFGTNLSAAPLVEGIGRLTEVAATLPDIAFVDAGGGFRVSMPNEPLFDFETYGAGVRAHLDRLELRVGRPVEYLLEPGRYLAASCGYFFLTVVDVKQRADRVFVGTNGSVAVFPRPLMYPDRAEHPCGVVGREPLEPPDPRPVFVCGSSTYSQDFLARGVRLPLPRVGDTLVFGHAGAYCRSMMTRFLGKDRPVEVVVDGSSSATTLTEFDSLLDAV